MQNDLFNPFSRRDFMRFGVQGAGATALWMTLGGLSAPAGADTSGYKALVCVYLAGGNNGFNTVVPLSEAKYAEYLTTRGNLALTQGSLLSLNGAASDGNAYGLHPSCTMIRARFNTRGNVAIIGNVGTLVQPTTIVQARAAFAQQPGAVTLPLQLFSHADQQTQWMTSTPDQANRTGWAGRIADLYVGQSYVPKLAMNINVGGTNYWQEGQQTMPYALGVGGATVLRATSDVSYRAGTRMDVARGLQDDALQDSNLMTAQFATIERNADGKIAVVNNAFGAIAASDVFTSLPNDGGFAQQLQQVARTIRAQALIGDSRQIFFVQLGGFDTHNNELAQQAHLWQVLDTNLDQFWKALEGGTDSAGIDQRAIAQNVTVFTASDFGRSLGSNGDGSDHAWGSHHIVMGGAVKGGFYGTMPDLRLEGNDDVGTGRVLPSTPTDQYAATLTRWFGVGDGDLDAVFPNLSRFGQAGRNLGFLG